MAEKALLDSALPFTAEPHTRHTSRRRRAAWLLVPLAAAAYLTAPHVARTVSQISWRTKDVVAASQALCFQPDALFPTKSAELDNAYEHLFSSAFRNASIERLAGAVQVRTETFDDLGEVGEDPRWEVFFNFYAYLQKTFPLLHEKLQVEKVNTHGLLYTWQGSDPDLKPTVLMAHQDTVPVPTETIETWTYPPWSGAYDGKFIWGRGSSDCKNQLIAELEATELLLQAGFQPKRTLILSFGYDEESFGYHGAGNLSAVIRDRYGKDGLAVVIDEGAGIEQAWGTVFAKPGTTEKGSTNVEVVVRTPGGHSSIPRDHTGIGIISDLITKIEATQYPTHLDERNPYYSQLHCGAAYSPKFPPKLKKLLAQRPSSPPGDKPDYLAIEAAKQGPEIKYLLQTSQAVDVISGGVKVNALPERVKVVINHRVNIGETIQVVYDRLAAISDEVAKKYNLTLHAFDGKEEPLSISLSAPSGLDFAPITPSDGSVISPFSILAGSVRATYGDQTIVTPGIITGNTDTRFFWELTRHIFRFAPGFDPEDAPGLTGVHTVNEKVNVNNHINAVRFFTLFIRNIDEAEL
ncbi:Carboxypeptidase [Pleurostoma richardsiae]|uniref:Carboxypeptidase n=1 Tax=Pleurostoma richardsiae TaxID=41990 RepID=A0AA38VGU5_9PEZI|nr:Carboxypeptidase [Pleurostoma richardsiae]